MIDMLPAVHSLVTAPELAMLSIGGHVAMDPRAVVRARGGQAVVHAWQPGDSAS
jgi:hypothetical protein